MNDIFSFQRGKLLFDIDNEKCALSENERSKSQEHNVFERSKTFLICENEKSQKTEKNEENKS